MELIFSELDLKKIENAIESKKCFHNFCTNSLTSEVMFLSIENEKAKVIFIERENLYYNNNGSLHISKGDKTQIVKIKKNKNLTLFLLLVWFLGLTGHTVCQYLIKS